MLDVCGGIQHAHARGVIHRDLKPDNILVSMADGSPRPGIIDFGLAKALAAPIIGNTAFTLDGQMLGTPEYMSPEQANASPDIDVRTDVYSLGCILYEVLTGRPPFTSEELRAGGREGMARILTEREPSPPSRVGGMPLASELDWITLKCLEKSPDRRYATVDALAADLGRFRRGERVEAGPPARLYRLSRWVARRRAVVAAGVLAVAGLIAGLVVALVYAAESRQSAVEAAQVSRITREILTSVNPQVAQGRDPELLLMMLKQSESVFKQALSPKVECELHETFALAYRNAGRLVLAQHGLRTGGSNRGGRSCHSARRMYFWCRAGTPCSAWAVRRRVSRTAGARAAQR